MWLLIALGHMVAEVLDEFTTFLEVFQLLLVLLAQVRWAVGIVCCTELNKIILNCVFVAPCEQVQECKVGFMNNLGVQVV